MDRDPGSWLIAIGAMLILLGALYSVGWLNWFGRLPGDIRIEGENARFYFPVTTMILLSVVLSALLWLWNRLQ